MKILALGALWVPYISENWFDAIRHVLGDEAVCVNAGPLLAGKENYGGPPEGFQSAYIYDLLRSAKFDYLFFYHDWIFGDFPDEFFAKVRLAGVRTVAFHPDDEPEHWYARNSAYDHHFDIVASHSSAGAERRKLAGWGSRSVYLPWGYNQRNCRRIADLPKRYDVVFIGKHKVNDAHGQAHVEDGAQREQILVRLAEACERRGRIFRVFGFGWEKHPLLARYAGGVPTQEGMVRILNQARIVFNPAWSSDGNPNAVQTKLRHFEVPGCGAFQITNENPELAQLYAPGEEIVFYRTDDDLLEKVDRFVSDDAGREAIARAGHARSLRDHTLDHRVTTLFESVRAHFPPHRTAPARRPAVSTLHVEGASALRQLQQDLKNDDSCLGDAEWVHIVGGGFRDVKTDYATLEPFFQRFPTRVLSTSTYLDFAGLASNPLQPKLMESSGRILAEDINVDDVDLPLLDHRGGCFLGSQVEEKACLLVNYVAARTRIGELLDAFATGALDTIHRLAAIPTGRIVTEVLIEVPAGHELAGGGIRNTEYVRRLRALLPRFTEQKARVVIYGISGMGEITLKLVEQFAGLNLIGIVDRSLSASHFHGIPVCQPSELREIRPDVIILTSGSSGPSIYASIAHLEAMTCILPLYDLKHPVWSIVR